MIQKFIVFGIKYLILKLFKDNNLYILVAGWGRGNPSGS